MTTLRRLSRVRLASTAAALAAFALGLGGCISRDGQGVSLEQTMAKPKFVALAPPVARDIAPRAAAALPPGAGPVVSIRDRRYGGGFRQDVLLGEGAVRTIANGITVFAHEPGAEALGPLPFAKPTQGSIATELGAQFPGIAMEVVVRHFVNAYGSYGVALGRGVGEIRCLYAWQWIDDQNRLARDGMIGPVSVRVRLCRAGQTFDEMATLMDGLVLGRNAAIVLQASEPSVVAVVEAPDVGTSRARAPTLVIHPTRHRFHTVGRRAAHRHETTTVQTSNEVPLTAARTSAARYMAPLDAPVAPRGEAAGSPESGTSKLSADLPTQAYLGPLAASRVVASAPGASR